MGPPNGGVPRNSFTFNNITNDSWPWFSHQHDVTYASAGGFLIRNGITGPMLTIFDNGSTRVSAPPVGAGRQLRTEQLPQPGHGLDGGRSQHDGDARADPGPRGVPARAFGAAQILNNGNYFFSTGILTDHGHAGMNLETVDYAYRVWQMPDLYNPPVL